MNWEKAFDKEFPRCDCRNNEVPHFDETQGKTNRTWIKHFIKTVVAETKKETIQECIDLSDRAELEYPTEFNEWRSLKSFRNQLRDKLIN